MRGTGVAIEQRAVYCTAMSCAVFFTILQVPFDVTISIARRLRGEWQFMRRWPYRRTLDFLFQIVLLCTFLL